MISLRSPANRSRLSVYGPNSASCRRSASSAESTTRSPRTARCASRPAAACSRCCRFCSAFCSGADECGLAFILRAVTTEDSGNPRPASSLLFSRRISQYYVRIALRHTSRELHSISADARELFAREHVHHPGAAHARFHHHESGMFGNDFADDSGFLA